MEVSVKYSMENSTKYLFHNFINNFSIAASLAQWKGLRELITCNFLCQRQKRRIAICYSVYCKQFFFLSLVSLLSVATEFVQRCHQWIIHSSDCLPFLRQTRWALFNETNWWRLIHPWHHFARFWMQNRQRRENACHSIRFDMINSRCAVAHTFSRRSCDGRMCTYLSQYSVRAHGNKLLVGNLCPHSSANACWCSCFFFFFFLCTFICTLIRIDARTAHTNRFISFVTRLSTSTVRSVCYCWN